MLVTVVEVNRIVHCNPQYYPGDEAGRHIEGDAESTHHDENKIERGNVRD